MLRALSGVVSLFVATLVLSTPALALEIPIDNDPTRQCHNPHTGGGNLQVDWDFLGFDSGNPHGHLFLNNLRIDFDVQFADVGDLHKPATGNEIQFANLFFASGEGATFNFPDIQSITLASESEVAFRGIQVRPLGQNFLLTIVTDTETLLIELESIMGSQINFDRNGNLTGMNLRFCGSIVSVPPPPPPVPEPASLFAVGLAGASLVSAARKKLARV